MKYICGATGLFHQLHNHFLIFHSTIMATEKNNLMQDDRQQIISYQKLRAFIGLIGIFLPVVVVLGSAILGAQKNSWQHSISHYYYSKMHVIFVASLCVLGGFLITYKGRNKWESRVSNLAGTCAFGIAAFPTCFDGFQPPVGGANQYIQLLSPVNDFWGDVHFGFAAALFICFIIFCLHFFQTPDKEYTGREAIKFIKRKKFYTFCGWGIIISIIMIIVFKFIIKPEEGIFVYSTYIFETSALWSFGLAWLVKGSESLREVVVFKHVVKSLR
jgi:hypothetical protein